MNSFSITGGKPTLSSWAPSPTQEVADLLLPLDFNDLLSRLYDPSSKSLNTEPHYFSSPTGGQGARRSVWGTNTPPRGPLETGVSTGSSHRPGRACPGTLYFLRSVPSRSPSLSTFPPWRREKQVDLTCADHPGGYLGWTGERGVHFGNWTEGS